jgi:hypothetical protein
MYSSQTEISIIDNTQHSLLLFHYGFIYIIVCSILCGIGYTFYTKIYQLLKDLNEKYDVQLKNNVIDFNIKMDTMEIKYQNYIQKLETQIKRFECKVDENNDYITDFNIKIDTMKNKTETIVNDFNIKIEKLDFQVEHFKNMGQETKNLLSISTDKNIELINNTQQELNIIKTQIVDMKDTVVSQDQFQRLETQNHTNANDAQNYFKLISNYVTKTQLQDLLVGYVSQEELDEAIFEISETHRSLIMVNNDHPSPFGITKCTKCMRDPDFPCQICRTCYSESMKHWNTSPHLKFENKVINSNILPYLPNDHNIDFKTQKDHIKVIRINKKYYLYFQQVYDNNYKIFNLKGEKSSSFLERNGIKWALTEDGRFHDESKYNIMGVNTSTQLVWHEVGLMDSITKKVYWH